MTSILKRTVAVVALLSVATAGALGPKSARANSDDDKYWKGPGIYELFYSTGVYLVYSGPYADVDSCMVRAKKRIADAAWMTRMYHKYGDFGDKEHGWTIYCNEIGSKKVFDELMD